jgi:hypothetical protein
MLRLETQGGSAASEPTIGFKDGKPAPPRRATGAFPAQPAAKPSAPPAPKNDFDDLIER